MAEEKITTVDKIINLLDLQNDIEQIPIGPNEEERNESRLRKDITGEKRPLSHTIKEAGAWSTANILLPFVAAVIKGANVVSKGQKGLKLINNAAKEGKSIEWAMKKAAKATKKASKKAAKEVAENAPKSKSTFGKLIELASQTSPSNIKARIAKNDEKAVKTAIKAMGGVEPVGTTGEQMIKEYGIEKGAKTLAGTMAAEKAGDIIANGIPDTGTYNEKVRDIDFDPRIEMSGGRKLWQFIKGLFDFDELNPDIYPMDKVNDVLMNMNKEAKVWNREQLERLGDDEKIKLVKDIAKGKYDTNDLGLSSYLYNAYMDLTNNDEEK